MTMAWMVIKVGFGCIPTQKKSCCTLGIILKRTLAAIPWVLMGVTMPPIFIFSSNIKNNEEKMNEGRMG